MIKIYLLDFSGADADLVCRSALPGSIEKYIEKTGNKTLKRERIFSYFLLSFAFERELSHRLPEIERDENGRPYFIGEKIDFNISHDGSFAAAVLSDEGRCGIDIQRCRDSVSEGLIKKTEKLYGERVTDGKIIRGKLGAEIEMLSLNADGSITHGKMPSLCEKGSTEDSDSAAKTDGFDKDFFIKWSQTEAIAKADGRGLSLFSEIDLGKSAFILKSAKVKDKNGEDYALSAALKEL